MSEKNLHLISSLDDLLANVCPDMAIGSATTRTRPAGTASPARPSSATAAAPARLTSPRKKFASKYHDF